jgi:hypothetical protein
VEVLVRFDLAVGWLALLTMWGCSLSHPATSNIDRGVSPQSSAVFCDVEDLAQPRRCATLNDLAVGIRLSERAEALADHRSSTVGLDDTPGIVSVCGGVPETIFYKCPFPQGCAVCLNCGVIGTTFTDGNQVCQALCADLNGPRQVPPVSLVSAFCSFPEDTHLSTNFSAISSSCFAGVCQNSGTFPAAGFMDPRGTPETVVWMNPIGLDLSLDVTGGTLSRLEANTSGTFDAGASSGPGQLITVGGGFVQFTVLQANHALALGLSSGAPPDNDGTLTDMTFAIGLTTLGQVVVSEGGNLVLPDPANPANVSWGTYAAGDTFRVAISLQPDGSAAGVYSHNGVLLPTAGHTSRTALYPFRVDVSLKDQGASVGQVGLVRIRS